MVLQEGRKGGKVCFVVICCLLLLLLLLFLGHYSHIIYYDLILLNITGCICTMYIC